MPQRFLRPGITTSKRFNRCDLFAQSLYVRLLTLVDDFGRYEADSELIRSLAFPFGGHDSSCYQLTTIVSGLTTLADNELLVLYELDGKQYLQLTRWQERARSKSRYPSPSDNKCCQLTTNDNSCQQMLAPSPSPSPSPTTLVFRVRLAKLFGRPRGEQWTYAEESTLFDLSRRPQFESELDALEKFKSKPESFFPQSLQALLNKWTETLDRARNYENNRKPSHNRNAGTFNANQDTAAIQRKIR